MSHEEMAKIAGCSKRTIEKWCTEKHKLKTWDRAKNKILNPLQQDLIIGSLLGDGHIDKRDKYPLFVVCHAENQKDYLYYKYNILKDLCRMTPTYYKENNSAVIKGRKCQCQGFYRFNTGTYSCLDKYRKMTVFQIADCLTEYSLSIWLLDDGSRNSKGYWQLCVARYNSNEKLYLSKILKDKFNISAFAKKDSRYWNFHAKDSRSLDNIILSNIPNDLDIIQYKIFKNRKE